MELENKFIAATILAIIFALIGKYYLQDEEKPKQQQQIIYCLPKVEQMPSLTEIKTTNRSFEF